ncbi:TetR/AcrR family transcriptional regulator [Streptomyces demainii]|uniref:AcrR family transcriptional regulator n=1 Tax=Streptomyces demainii TaxID=588122 RepID=A0ABT9KZ87_9ACTN|nr:TetR/AcrR family transcriptional regulator [Streptomyces demainii]MDP9613769.1 AcrR family transcriptional regulator [Streptomyces demainii]
MSADTDDGPTASPLRADARRNREQILRAAREVFTDQGPDAPLDEMARRAGVGIATLYRRFPRRDDLHRGVAVEVLTALIGAANRAAAEEDDACLALRRFMLRPTGCSRPTIPLGGPGVGVEAFKRLRERLIDDAYGARADADVRADAHDVSRDDSGAGAYDVSRADVRDVSRADVRDDSCADVRAADVRADGD